MATKLHKDLTGADVHPNAIDGTTGTELTTPALTILDGRWVKQAGGSTITRASAANALNITLNGDTGSTVSETAKLRCAGW